jgi:hypothetical protein
MAGLHTKYLYRSRSDAVGLARGSSCIRFDMSWVWTGKHSMKLRGTAPRFSAPSMRARSLWLALAILCALNISNSMTPRA